MANTPVEDLFPIPDHVKVISPAQALEFIQEIAHTEVWWDRVRRKCAEQGITDEEEIEAELAAHQNDLDDLIWMEDNMCYYVTEARKLLGRDKDNNVIDVEATEIK